MQMIAYLCGLLACLVISAPAAAQRSGAQFPSQPITLVVPYAAGGNVDVSTRILQAALGDSLGQPIIVENRTGAAGLIAGAYVARSAPDGHTLFVGSNGPLILGPMTMPNPPYHWDTGFEPISSLAFATNMLLARPTLSAGSVPELVAYAHANPGKLTLATSSGASINHFLAALFRQRAGIKWVEVSYKGNAPAINDLIGGHVDVGFQQLSDSLQHIQSGKLRPLAVLRASRSPSLPDVPSIAEAGYPDVQGVTFNGVLAPKGTPPEILEKLSAAIRSALTRPDVVEKLAALGSEARGSTPAEFKRFLEEDAKKWAAVIKEADIKIAE
jgi:tripartite-type tricarboxylate transporter receptor subunit TctC